MTVHSPGPIIWTYKDLTLYLRASLFFVTLGVRKNSSYTRTYVFVRRRAPFQCLYSLLVFLVVRKLLYVVYHQLAVSQL
jgi:hypothetical protein